MTKNFNKICRLCMKEPKEKLLPLFDKGNIFLEKINCLVPVLKLHLNDGLPEQVCSQCIQQVNESYNFKLQCETTDLTLKQLIEQEKSQKSMERIREDFSIAAEVKKEEPEIIMDEEYADTDNRDSSGSQDDDEYSEQPDAIQSEIIKVATNTCNNKETVVIWNCCSLKFKRASHLQCHMIRHTGEKSFSCLDCGREFGRRDSLKKHMHVHLGLKPFLCTICGKRFTQSQQLKIHIPTHSEKKPFMCFECGKTFASNSRLKDHMTVHSGKRPFSCPHCIKTFVRREHLKHHLNAVHGKQIESL
ncbi:Transcription factor Ouib [Blattella germanica]|nr:Transcription factor Ouib [Blattella germanica]